MAFTPFIIIIITVAYCTISFFLGISIHASFIYENKKGLDKNSKKSWVLSYTAGLGITTWLFIYGYKTIFIWNTGQ
tara:strand:+ start:1939 stop:2166 length:228 start_codon:yes stop_codon:yes gene_type:complete